MLSSFLFYGAPTPILLFCGVLVLSSFYKITSTSKERKMQLKGILFQHIWIGALCSLQVSMAKIHPHELEIRSSLWQTELNQRGGANPLPPTQFDMNVQQQQQQSSSSSQVIPDYYQDYDEQQQEEQQPPVRATTVQDEIDSWRAQQRQRADATQYSPRDDKGRMKLLTSVSKGSRVLIFFVLMLRDIHLYEVADVSRKGLSRILCVTPLIFLFLSNMVGVFASLTNPSHNTKKRLKAILNLDKFVEAILIVFYLLRLTLFPPAHIPREIYIANIFHSVFFLLQAQAFTRLSWDETEAPPINSYTAATSSSQHHQQQQFPPTPPYYTEYDKQHEQLSVEQQQPRSVSALQDSHSP